MTAHKNQPKKVFRFAKIASAVDGHPSFAEYTYRVHVEGELSLVSLVLPADPHTYERCKLRAEETLPSSEETEEEKAWSSAAARIRESQKAQVPESRAVPEHRAAEDLQAKEAIDLDPNTDQDSDSVKVPIYEVLAPLSLLSKTTSADRDKQRRDEAIFARLLKLGRWREVAPVPNQKSLLEALEVLHRRQPYFADVVRFLIHQVNLAAYRKTSLSFPPILIVGSPGVGKTHFVNELAKLLNRPLVRHSFDTAQTASSLAGSATNWSNIGLGEVCCRFR